MKHGFTEVGDWRQNRKNVDWHGRSCFCRPEVMAENLRLKEEIKDLKSKEVRRSWVSALCLSHPFKFPPWLIGFQALAAQRLTQLDRAEACDGLVWPGHSRSCFVFLAVIFASCCNGQRRNCKLQIALGSAGPKGGAREGSGQRRTLTGSSRLELASQVGSAGPQPPEKMPEDMSWAGNSQPASCPWTTARKDESQSG